MRKRMKTKASRRLLSLALSGAMVLSLLPVFAFAEERDKPNYEKAVNSEKDAGRENAVYGLNLAALKCYGGDTTGKKEVTDIVKYVGTAEADGVTLLVFDFKSEQPDLQYEAIAFINAVVRACSDII